MSDKGTNEYAGSKAPEVRKHADEQEGNFEDMRLIPGGARGTQAPQGIDALDRGTVPNEATDTEQTRYRDSAGEPNR